MKETHDELPNHSKSRGHFFQYLAGSKRSVREGDKAYAHKS